MMVLIQNYVLLKLGADDVSIVDYDDVSGVAPVVELYRLT